MAWWNISSVPGTVVAGNVGYFSMVEASLTGFPPQMQGGLTIIRAILEVSARSLTAATSARGAFGLYVAIQGTTTLPIVDLVDYYWHKSYNLLGVTATERYEKFEIDLRTKRKLRGLERRLLFAFEVSSGSPASVEFAVAGRFLLQAS